jgi:GTPase SAR1 family protein
LTDGQSHVLLDPEGRLIVIQKTDLPEKELAGPLEVNLAILGNEGAGKSSVVERFVDQTFGEWTSSPSGGNLMYSDLNSGSKK